MDIIATSAASFVEQKMPLASIGHGTSTRQGKTNNFHLR